MKGKLLFVTAAIILFIIPNSNFGQAPDLGAASSFSLFTSAGAFNNAGTTIVTGDIGSNTVALTGFPPGKVTGILHAAPDAVTSQAATDVGLAYSYMSMLGGTVLGVSLGGQTLTAGIYNTGAASNLTGSLTLDAQGDPNAIFIIRIGGALTVGAASNVILSNSASVCNVYWQVGGQFDLAAGSGFNGTIIADGAINLLSGSSLQGRALTRAGAITTNTVTVNNNLVVPAGNISGTSTLCQGRSGFVYSVPVITNAANYLWTLPAGAVIISGSGTNSITVDFSTNAASGNITVQGINSCSSGTVSPYYPLTVNPLPVTTLIYHY
jgi:hypothetical protein